MSTRKIDHLLSEHHNNRSTPLKRLIHTAAAQRQWTAELQAVLDDALKHEVEVTAIHGATAAVLCRSAATATRLRFLTPEILPQLHQLASFARVRELSIRVASSSKKP